MKALWITNLPINIGKSSSKKIASGSWIEAALNSFSGAEGVEIIIATTIKTKEIKIEKHKNITQLMLPGGRPSIYSHKSTTNIRIWEKVYDQFRPDIIHLWGTEYGHGLAAYNAMPDVPKLVYMQGVITSIRHHVNAGVSCLPRFMSNSLKDYATGNWFPKSLYRINSQAKTEAELLRKANAAVTENSWCESFCKYHNDEINIYYSKLPINNVFYEKNWNPAEIEHFSIICNAQGGFIKGLHKLLYAIKHLSKEFPQIKLYIPGSSKIPEKNIFKRFAQNSYEIYSRRIIRKLNLHDRVHFLGYLKPDELACHILRKNVFVLPSSIENHSSSLIEAMLVGIPCISSNVGGISEYLRHNENGLLYRFEEFEVLASHIRKVFKDKAFALKIGGNAKKSIMVSRDKDNFKKDFLQIYNDIINKSKI